MQILSGCFFCVRLLDFLKNVRLLLDLKSKNSEKDGLSGDIKNRKPFVLKASVSGISRTRTYGPHDVNVVL